MVWAISSSVRRVDVDVGNFAGLDVDGLVGVDASDGLEDGAEIFVGARMGPPRRSEAVNDQIDCLQVSRIAAMVSALISSEKASPLMLRA